MFRFGWLLVCTSVVFAQAQPSPQELLNEAVALHQAGKLDEAIKDYQQLVSMYPNLPQVRSNLGAALAGAGRYSEAIEQYKKALAIQPDPKVRLNLALAYYKASEFEPAIKELTIVHQALPGDTQALMLLADCNLQLGENKKVVELLEPLHKANPADLGVAYMLGTALVRDGQTAEGQLVIDPILKNGDSAEARLLMGTTKMSVRDFAGARDDLKRAVELNPDLPDVYSYYGAALLATGDQPGAEKAFAEELKHNSNNFEANLRMGVLLKQDNDFDGAMKYLQRALRVRPGNLPTRYQIATVLLAESHVEEARQQLEKIVKESPDFTEAHVSLATAYYRLKRKADGDKERKVVAALNAKRQANEPAAKAAAGQGEEVGVGDPAENSFSRGRRMFAAGDYPGALEQFASAVASNSNIPELEAYYGQSLLFTGDADGAAAAFRKELSRDPNNFAANLGLAQILTKRKQLSEAFSFAEKSVALRPRSAEALMALGEYEMAAGNYQDARKPLESAIDVAPRSLQLHQDLATVYGALRLTVEESRERKIVAQLAARGAGPQINDVAPDFTLSTMDSSKTINLNAYRGGRPAVLVFGSYTCPNFRSAVPALDELFAKYGQKVPFLLVYIREAHGGNSWQSTRNQRENINVSDAANLAEKQQHAVMCTRKLNMKFPAVVDGMERKVESQYAAWPSRAVLIGADGNVLYSTRLTELDFNASDLEAAMRSALHRSIARER